MTDTKEQVCVWSVEFSSDEGKSYRYNKYVTVITTTAQRAIVLVIEKHPTASIHALHKRSRGDLLVDSQIHIKEHTDDNTS